MLGGLFGTVGVSGGDQLGEPAMSVHVAIENLRRPSNREHVRQAWTIPAKPPSIALPE